MPSDPYYYTKELFDIQSQKRALGQGQPFSPQDISNIMGQTFYEQQVIGEREREYNLRQQQQAEQKRQFDEQAAQQKKEARRANVAGYAQMAINVPLAYGAGKAAGWWGTTPAAGAGGAETGTAAAGGSAIPGYAPGQAAITGASEGAGGGAGAAGAEAGTAAGTAGTMGGATTVGAAAGGVGLVAGSSWLTGRVFASHGLSENTGRFFGAFLPQVFGPTAGAIHVGERIVQKIFHGSIICTELKRQGMLDESMHRASSIYVLKHVDKETYYGYLIVAGPIVEQMQRSKLFTYLMRPYGYLLCRECASRTSWKSYKSTWFSRLVYNTSVNIFKKVYNRTIKNISKGVCHA